MSKLCLVFLVLFLGVASSLAQTQAALDCWDASDEEVFMVLSSTDPKLLKAWVDILSRSQNAAKRATCAWALAYDDCFVYATETFEENYRVNKLLMLLEDKDLMVQLSAILACHSINASEARAVLGVIEKISAKNKFKESDQKEILKVLKSVKEKSLKKTSHAEQCEGVRAGCKFFSPSKSVVRDMNNPQPQV
ncbi:hypothetical protein [Prosthecobacter sp.]|uniref:hypothetical protein n=1 Tax=Prosthecobacter sp. TaxID=1965333 RepID=UPI00378431F8